MLAKINFGIADFDTEDTVGLEPELSGPSTSQQGSDESIMLAQSIEYDDKYDRIKARKRTIDIREEFNDSYSSSEEYIPYPDEVSDELTDEDFNEEDDKQRNVLLPQKKRKTKVGKHHEKLKSELKSQRHNKHKKVVDDGDIKAYLQRIRELRIKERLKESGRIDDVADSDLSEDEENDKKEIALKGGFVLPVKMWRKLYK